MAVNKQNLNPPYKKGQSGNPNGRPKGASLKSQVQTLFIEMLSEPVSYKKKSTPFFTAYKQEFIKQALNGGWSSKFLAERIFNDNILDEIDKSLNKDIREDKDFQQYRIHKKAHNVQKDILLDKNRAVYMMAGRRAGKTDCNKLKTVSVIMNDNSQVLIIGLTQETVMKLYWQGLLDIFEELGISVQTANKTEGFIQLANGSFVSLKGNNSVTDREKFRGFHWDLVIIDEAQSQSCLANLINDIIEPTLIDKAGQLFLSGSGPRVRGTYWEKLWSENPTASKYNWNLSKNPYIKNYEKVLEEVKKTKGLTDASPLFQREYLGLIVYDDDAQVYRLDTDNYFDDAAMVNWINSQPRADIKFASGLDYGFTDSDAFVIIMFSTSRPERWLVYEHKGNRSGITELANKVKEGIAYIENNPMFQSIPDRHFYIYSDAGGGGKKISAELSNQFGLPCLDAYKVNKDLAIEQLQEEVRNRSFKVRKDSVFADEADKTVWARNDKDELTRIIDDNTFHPDLLDAILYSLRYVWINYGNKELQQ